MGGIAAFRLGEWRVETAANTLTRAGEEFRLEPKVMEVLACLAAHAGEVISKRELIDEVGKVHALVEKIGDHRRLGPVLFQSGGFEGCARSLPRAIAIDERVLALADEHDDETEVLLDIEGEAAAETCLLEARELLAQLEE